MLTLTACERKPDNDMAFIISQNFVKGTLLNPAAVKFPFVDYTCSIDANAYIIRSYFDAPEGRVPYRCVLKYKNGDTADPRNWELLDLKAE